MEYKQYGKDGPMISRLGFGVMRLPGRKRDDWGSVNFKLSVELILSAMKRGVNFFDSHHNYHLGKSEIAIGKALKKWKGQRIYIQTKTPWYNEQPRKYFEKLLYEALEKLGVESIDYLLHHCMNMKMWKSRGRKFIKFTDWALKKGLIRYRGLSSHDTPENIKKFINTGEFSAMLVSYNWMNPGVRDAIAHAHKKGMGVTVMNPVGGGVLATSTPHVMRLVRGAKSAAEIALRYVLATPGVTGALSGMNTMKQIRDNAAVASRKKWMTPKQSKEMRVRLKKIQKRSRLLCTACGYCMPCKQGVDIPGNFGLLNRVKFYGHLRWAKAQYGGFKSGKDGNRSAEACIQCGACEPKCPNKVPIIKQLEETARLLG